MNKLVLQLRIIANLSAWGSTAIVCNQAADEIERLTNLVNTPMYQPFDRAVKLEAAHQVNRWGTVHDRKKEPQEWFWLVGYLAGKALRAHLSGDRVKATHHTVSSAAVLFHWHAHIVANVENDGAVAQGQPAGGIPSTQETPHGNQEQP